MSILPDLDAIQKEMRIFCNKMMEFGVDSIQIVSTAKEEVASEKSRYLGSTCLFASGGNSYANIASVERWLNNSKQDHNDSDTIYYEEEDMGY